MRIDSTAGAPEPDFLERAAESVIENAPAEPLLAPDEQMLREALGELVQGVRDALMGHEPVAPKHMQIDRALLLRALRRAVLDAWSDDEGSLLETVRAFERTERTLVGADGEGVEANPFSRSLLREVVHLLLSPLGSMVMLVGTLREERAGPLNEKQHRQLGIIHRAATSAASASSDILTLTSPEEHYQGAQRFSVADTIATVADVVRPVTEARGSELVVQVAVERPRRGPVDALALALLGLATRLALMTRDGTVRLGVDGGAGDVVSFSLTGGGEAGKTIGDGDPFLMFRTGPGSDGYTLSPEALSLSAGRQILQAMGSDLEVTSDADGAVALRFELTLPVAE